MVGGRKALPVATAPGAFLDSAFLLLVENHTDQPDRKSPAAFGLVGSGRYFT
jgi:hypothetical protein